MAGEREMKNQLSDSVFGSNIAASPPDVGEVSRPFRE